MTSPMSSNDPLLRQLETTPAKPLGPLTVRLLVEGRDHPDTDAATRQRITTVLAR